jgi:hypothetical protein
MMINNVKTNPASHFPKVSKQAENKPRNNIRLSTSFSDKIEISDEARAASRAKIKSADMQQKIPHRGNTKDLYADEQDDTIEKILEEYRNSGSIGRTDDADDAAAAERRNKLAAMKIAMRISNGDNVPLQDHRFLAEYDPNLYKAALKASLVADNKDPKDYDSLVDEMAADENARMRPESEKPESVVDGITGDTADIEGDIS